MDKKMEAELLSCLKGFTFRWRSLGARDGELLDLNKKISSVEDWIREYNDIATAYEKAADAITDRVVKTSNYLSAAVYFHSSQLGLTSDTDRKKEIFYASVRAYFKAAQNFTVPLERVEFPYDGKTLSAYFRKKPGIKNRPTVVLIRGADASRVAEDHIITEYLLHNGFSVFNIDMPGQYEARFNGLALIPDTEKPVGAAIDYLEKRPEVDPERIVVFGSCVGGFMAPRACALEKRAKACVSIGGFYSLAEFEYPLLATLNVQNDMQVTPAEYPQRRKEFTLKGFIEKMTCPLLVINGAEDTVMPNSQAVKIYEQARCPKELKIYQGLNHNAWHQNREALNYAAGWLWDKLGGKPA